MSHAVVALRSTDAPRGDAQRRSSASPRATNRAARVGSQRQKKSTRKQKIVDVNFFQLYISPSERRNKRHGS
jgi:hypothetical protein